MQPLGTDTPVTIPQLYGATQGIGQFLRRIPVSIAEKISSETQLQSYNDDFPDVPEVIYPLVCDSNMVLVVNNSTIYSIVATKDQLKKQMRRFYKETKMVRKVIKTSLPLELRYLFTSKICILEGYQNISQHFFKELQLERTQLLSRLNQVPFKNLHSYMHNFSKLVAEYEDAGGNRS